MSVKLDYPVCVCVRVKLLWSSALLARSHLKQGGWVFLRRLRNVKISFNASFMRSAPLPKHITTAS